MQYVVTCSVACGGYVSSRGHKEVSHTCGQSVDEGVFSEFVCVCFYNMKYTEKFESLLQEEKI